MPKQYWLMKTEPGTFSFDDLKSRPNQTEPWDGVRNYQARNFMRDKMKVGDGILFYHSVVKPPAVVGLAKVASESYPDPTQFDPKSNYYDPKSTPEKPRWFLVDVTYDRDIKSPVTLEEIRDREDLSEMPLVNRSRLSVMPIEEREWKIIVKMSDT